MVFSNILSAKNNIIVMRHGEGDHNVGRFHNSNAKHPNYKVANLTEKGKLQVQQTARNLSDMGFNKDNINLILVSPLPRTVQTSEILLSEGVIAKNNIKIEPRLIEIQVGDLEGQPYEEGKDFWDHSDGHKYGGEDEQDVRFRVVSLLKDLKNTCCDKNIMLVTHGTPSQQIIKYILGEEAEVRLETSEAKVFNMDC